MPGRHSRFEFFLMGFPVWVALIGSGLSLAMPRVGWEAYLSPGLAISSALLFASSRKNRFHRRDKVLVQRRPGGFRYYASCSLSVAAILVLLIPLTRRLLLESRRQETGAQLQALFIAQQAHFKEYGRYSADWREIAFNPARRGGIYLELSNIPGDDMKLIPPEALPFVDKDRFRALALLKRRRQLEILVVDERGEVRRVPVLDVPAAMAPRTVY